MLKNKTPFIHEGIKSSYIESDTIIIGMPFDATSSYRPGSRFGPQCIRNEFDCLETYSPYRDKDLTDYRICDIGDIELPPGNTEKALDIIEKELKSVLDDNKKIISIGGEHLISYPAIKSFSEKYNDLCILHFDAHADLRDDYLDEKLSHATVIRRIFDCVSKDRIYQFGIRSGTKEEFELGKTMGGFYKYSLDGLQEVIEAVANRPVYLTIDLDILDPSVLPGTGTPEPGGISFNDLLEAFNIMKDINLKGADIVELSPHYDKSGVSTVVACKVLRELLLLINNRNC
jgi:agmatinase